MILKQDCLVSTDTGVYRGTQKGAVQVYKGIRYALPPIGELRFHAPIPVSNSSNIIDAQSFSPVAKQPGYLSPLNGDDCLSLNIWRNVNADGNSPVLFYVHGGSFVQGSGRESIYSGTVLARDFNVVVVTINYRLGAFGFLDFSDMDSNCTANPGLLDVVTALKWVHKNIAAFGGDPNKITAAGESAGGSIISVLPMLDDAAPLINRLIMMSGIPTSFSPARSARGLIEKFMIQFNIKDSEGLRNLTDKQIVSGTTGFMRASDLGVGTFQPVIDGKYLKDFPITLIQRGEYKPMPMLIGFTRDELSLMEYPLLRRSWDTYKASNYDVKTEEDAMTCSASVYEEDLDTRESRIQANSDLIFRGPELLYAEEASSENPVWLYRFDLRTAFMRAIGLGAVHASDLPLVFGNLRRGPGILIFSQTPDIKGARRLSREMQSDIAGFMNNGTMNWARAFTDGYTAKCYDIPVSFDEPIPLDAYNCYREINYIKPGKKQIE